MKFKSNDRKRKKNCDIAKEKEAKEAQRLIINKSKMHNENDCCMNQDLGETQTRNERRL